MSSKDQSCLCVIGARKGSQRLPAKNRALLNGKPLYAYTVEAAKKSGIFSDIIFTTDDEIILNDLKNDVDIVLDHRPSELAGDNVVMWDVVIYILNKYRETSETVDSICLLTPCNPFRAAKHIQASYELFKKNATSLISLTEFPAPPELVLQIEDSRVIRNWKGPHRSADHNKKYYPNGAIIIVDRQFIMTHREFYSSNTVGYLMNWPYAIDIDEEQDLKMARVIAEKLFA